jgi:hypothetical protein
MNRKRLLLELFLYAILTIVGLSLLFTRQPKKVEPITIPIQSEQIYTQPEGGISLDTIFDQQSEHRTA